MRRGVLLATALAIAAASPAHAQAPPPPDRAAQGALAHGLFGEDEPEPGDEDVAAGRVEPPTAPPPSPATSSEAYDARVRSSFQAAEAFQGPLDGGFTLSDRDGPAYALQLADHQGVLEGVWRDLRRSGASGVVEVESRTPSRLKLRLAADHAAPVRLDLHGAADGWSGRMQRGDGGALEVRMAKTSP